MTIAVGARDIKRIIKAVSTNLIARFAPGSYVNMTGETGRGLGEESVNDVANYFVKCFYEYFEKLKVPRAEIERFVAGKHALEYGPGDIPGVALLMIAHGAESVVCADRFPLMKLKPKNVQIIKLLLAMLTPEQRKRIEGCFSKPGDYTSGLLPEKIRYVVAAHGLSGLDNQADLIYSRAVLEHVNDLDATFSDMKRALKADGVAIHLVDLKSHGLHRDNPLDFLVWPAWLWTLMYGYKGVPNRWRVDKYRSILAEKKFDVRLMEPTLFADNEDIIRVRPFLAPQFQAVDEQDLRCLGFWVICGKEGV